MPRRRRGQRGEIRVVIGAHAFVLFEGVSHANNSLIGSGTVRHGAVAT